MYDVRCTMFGVALRCAGEVLKQGVTPLRVVPANTALQLKALLDFKEDSNLTHVAGDEWLFEGPGTYIPRKECSVEVCAAQCTHTLQTRSPSSVLFSEIRTLSYILCVQRVHAFYTAHVTWLPHGICE